MEAMAPERCDECGFDATEWEVADAGTLLRGLGKWWHLATEGVHRDILNTRPGPEVWSVLEYGVHTAFVTAVIRQGVDRMLAEDGLDLDGMVPVAGAAGAAASDPPLDLDPATVVSDIEREGRGFSRLARDAPAGAWNHRGTLGGVQVDARTGLLHAVHDATHHQMDVSRGLAATGAGAPSQRGHVVQINVSDGGVPKQAVVNTPGVSVTRRGLIGDRQADRVHHGRPFQAVSVWSLEVIDELAALGHPIAPGLAGENFTVTGIDWSSLRPGTLMRIGTVLAELSFPAIPCQKQTKWFSDGDFTRINHDVNPRWTRWYGWVRETGEVRAGDEVVVGS